tara:strand:- start:1164 stop:1370 length:207 start_codon:yes stop_codon:yes gene_type:complete
MIDVKFGISSTGFGGLIEQPKFDGLDVRVFEILDGHNVAWRHEGEWFSFGERARSYGCTMKIDSFNFV